VSPEAMPISSNAAIPPAQPSSLAPSGSNDAPSRRTHERNFRAVASARERLGAAHRDMRRPSAEIRFDVQRGVQPESERLARNLHRAEARQVLGRELRVEQPEPPGPKAREQMHKRDLRGVAGAVKHALAEEGAAQAHPVKTADERIALVGLERMRMAGGEQ